MTIRQKQEVDDGHGGFTPSDVAVVTRAPAAVEPLSGRELERAQQIDARISHRVRMRLDTRVKAGHEVIYHSGLGDTPERSLEIVGPPIDVDERHEEMLLMCKEAA